MEINRCYTCHNLFFGDKNCPKCGSDFTLKIDEDSAMEVIVRTLLGDLVSKVPKDKAMTSTVKKEVYKIFKEALLEINKRRTLLNKKMAACLNCGYILIDSFGFYSFFEEGYVCPECGYPKLSELTLKIYIDYILTSLKNIDNLFTEDIINGIKILNKAIFILFNDDLRRNIDVK